MSDIIWSARIVPDKNEEIEKHSNKVRVVFMLRDNWVKFVFELQIRELNIDAYINPFMSINPFSFGQNIALSMIDDEHVFLSNADGLREMSFAENIVQDEGQEKQILDYFVCMLVAKYVMSGKYDKYEKKLALKLAQNLIPQRNKLLKLFVWINVIVALIGLALLLYQVCEKVYCVYVEQRNATNLLETQIRNLQKQNVASKKNEKLYKKIQGAVPANLNYVRIFKLLT